VVVMNGKTSQGMIFKPDLTPLKKTLDAVAVKEH
jgi:hypothetical protein